MSAHEILQAAQGAIMNGDRGASALLSSSMFAALQSGFTHCLVLDVLRTITQSDASIWENLTVAHFLLTIVSSFFRRKLPQALRGLSEDARGPALSALVQNTAPKLSVLYSQILMSSIAPKMARRLRACIADAIVVPLLLSTHDIVSSADSFCKRLEMQGTHAQYMMMDVLRSAMSSLSDHSLQFGPICRSTNRIALQKQMDVVLVLPIPEGEAAPLLACTIEFLSNYSSLVPQEQCPKLYEHLSGSELWLSSLRTVASGDPEAVASVASFLGSIVTVDEFTAPLLNESMHAAVAHGSPETVSAIVNGLLEGPLSEILLNHELSDLCRWVEKYFVTLATHDAPSDREMLDRSVLLLLGALRPQPMPTMEDDDDEDDFASFCADISESNARKSECVQRLSEFLNWCARSMCRSGSVASPDAFEQLLDSWLSCDADQWEYDGPESFDGFALKAVILERLLIVIPGCTIEAADGNLLLWGASKNQQLLYEIANGQRLFDDSYGVGVAWYIGQVMRCNALCDVRAVWRNTWTSLCASLRAATLLSLLRIVRHMPPCVRVASDDVVSLSAVLWKCCVTVATFRTTVVMISELQFLGRADAPMPALMSWCQADWAPIDVQFGAFVCAWSQCAEVPHAAIGCAFSIIESLLSQPPDPVRITEQSHLWQKLAVVMAHYAPDTALMLDQTTHRLCTILLTGLGIAGLRDKLIFVACGYCRGPRVRRTASHAAVGKICTDGVTSMTQEQPLPLQEVLNATASAVLFEGPHEEWFVAFVLWLLQSEQCVALFRGAALQLISGLCDGCREIMTFNHHQRREPASWLHLTDTIVCYVVGMLSDGADGSSSALGDDDEVPSMLRKCSEFVHDVTSRTATVAIENDVSSTARSIMLGAVDAHEVAYRLRAAVH